MIRLYKNTYLSADAANFILFKKRTIETGKRKGNDAQVDHKYFSRLDFLFLSLFERTLMDELSKEDQTTLEEFKEKYMKLSTRFKKVSDRIGNVKNLIKLIKSDESLELKDISTEPVDEDTEDSDVKEMHKVLIEATKTETKVEEPPKEKVFKKITKIIKKK